MIDDYPIVGSSPDARSVSKRDQLTYNAVLQGIANRCLESKGTFDFKDHVLALRSALHFNIPGLPFADKIDKFMEELEIAMDKYRDKKISEIAAEHYIWTVPTKLEDLSCPHRAKLKIKLHKNYYLTMFEFLITLLAQHDALIKAKEFVESGEGDS